MARCRFLATAYDPRPGQEGIVYGAGHETDFDETDYEYMMALRVRGMVEIIDATGLPLANIGSSNAEPFLPPT